MKKTLLPALIAATLLATAAAPALAAGMNKNRDGNADGPRHGQRIERLIERLDADGDGSVTIAEAKQHATDMFTSVDADNSGTLSQEEFDMLKQIRDANRDEARQQRMADRGQGGQDDRQGMHARGKGPGKDGERHGPRFGQGQGQGHRGQGPTLARVDTDGNGTVSLEEFTAGSERMFTRLDRNADGVIDLNDFNRQRADAN